MLMELIILTAVVVGFIGNILIIRYFFKQLTSKLSQPQQPEIQKSQRTLRKFNWQEQRTTDPLLNPRFPIDQPAPNQVLNEDTNIVDFDETLPMPGVPPTVKFEVEGGDSQIPPGFEAQTV